MKTDSGQTIKGIWKYETNVTYTPDDLVLKGTVLYVCQSESSQIDPETDTRPDNERYKTYLEANSITTIDEYRANPNSNKVVPCNLILPILREKIGGLLGDGKIEEIPSSSNLDDFDSYGVYLLKVGGTNFHPAAPIQNLINNDYMLMRVYANGSTIIQECIDYENSIFYHRYNTGSGFSNWTSTSPNVLDYGLQTLNGDVIAKIQATQSVLSEYENLMPNTYAMRKVLGSSSGNEFVFTDSNEVANKEFLIVNLIYRVSGSTPFRLTTAHLQVGNNYSWEHPLGFTLTLQPNNQRITINNGTLSTVSINSVNGLETLA